MTVRIRLLAKADDLLLVYRVYQMATWYEQVRWQGR